VGGVGGRGAICPSAHTGDVTAPRWARAAFGPRANHTACVRMLTFVGVTAERVLECLGSERAPSGGWLRTGGGLLLTGVGFGYSTRREGELGGRSGILVYTIALMG
jgi:hypothetical protein